MSGAFTWSDWFEESVTVMGPRSSAGPESEVAPLYSA